eukprot:jgi/Picre1/30204/NNA_005573.t1
MIFAVSIEEFAMRKHCSICALLVTLLGRGAGSDDSAYIPSKRVDIRDFGARINGVTDDSRAIQDAIDNCEFSGGGVVELPPGTILLEDQITIRSSNIILMGAGKNETIIKIPHSLKYYDLQAAQMMTPIPDPRVSFKSKDGGSGVAVGVPMLQTS